MELFPVAVARPNANSRANKTLYNPPLVTALVLPEVGTVSYAVCHLISPSSWLSIDSSVNVEDVVLYRFPVNWMSVPALSPDALVAFSVISADSESTSIVEPIATKDACFPGSAVHKRMPVSEVMVQGSIVVTVYVFPLCVVYFMVLLFVYQPIRLGMAI